MALRAQASINLAAVERNVARLRRDLAPGVAFCAVVKADGYGHGARACARAAQAAGATWLAVATAEEAAGLRRAGIDGPILVLGALSHEELELALAARADVVAWSEPFVDRLAGRPEPVCVHVKLDTGMGRLGTRDRDRAVTVAERVLAEPSLALAGAMTHFATADADLEFVDTQLARFIPFVDQLRRRCPGLVVHAANSAATLRAPASHFDLVRCGIALYGCDPMQSDPGEGGTRAGAGAAQLRGGGQARAVPATAPGTAGASSPRQETWLATVPDRLRRRCAPRADQQLRCAHRRRALSARRDREHGQHHRRRGRAGASSAWARRSRSSAATAMPRADRRGSGPAAGHDQLRGGVRDLGPRATALSPRRGGL